MTNKQAIQDVAMIARNGIDRVIELERENKRLAEALLKANAQAEHFEREWYLRGDALDRLESANSDDLAALVRRLAHALRKAAPDNDLPEKALDYLNRKGFHGQVLRQDQNTEGASSC